LEAGLADNFEEIERIASFYQDDIIGTEGRFELLLAQSRDIDFGIVVVQFVHLLFVSPDMISQSRLLRLAGLIHLRGSGNDIGDPTLSKWFREVGVYVIIIQELSVGGKDKH
jgi:hypothetical protein